MAAPVPLPAARLVDDPGFLASIGPNDLVHFVCNVGDGDAQVVLLPQEPSSGTRRAMVVDAAIPDKVPDLIGKLGPGGLLPTDAAGKLAPEAIALCVASHPHFDHIGGMAQVLQELGDSISEFWDPGYFHTLPAYHDVMTQVEDHPGMLYAQPTSGFRRWISDVEVTVLSPSIQLRNRFDSYGIELNDSSISLRLEFPASRVLQLDQDRNYIGSRNSQALILGGDAQTLSWAYVSADFPQLGQSTSAAAKALKMATGSDPLAGQVLKVSHHASKHGVNLELVERISPALTLVSCTGGGGSYGFPHTVAQELIREALDPSVTSHKPHPVDADLDIFYTSDTDDGTPPAILGTMAVVMGAGKWTLWRFGDDVSEMVDLTQGRRWQG